MVLMTLKKKAFENNVGKGENTGTQHSFHFPQCFLPFLKQTSLLGLHLFYVLQILCRSIRTSQKFCRLVKSSKKGVSICYKMWPFVNIVENSAHV